MKLGAAGGQPAAWLSSAIRRRPVRVLVTTAAGVAFIAAVVTLATSPRGSAPARSAALSTGQVDLGQTWGRAFQGRTTAHEELSRAEAEANAVPAGAVADHATNTLRLPAGTANVTVVADPPNGRVMAFRVAGLENPTIQVKRETLVTMRFVNGAGNRAHGWLLRDPVVQGEGAVYGPRAFTGAYASILGDRTAAGQPVETIAFRATRDGTYRYECPVPGHAAMGMQGSLVVTG